MIALAAVLGAGLALWVVAPVVWAAREPGSGLPSCPNCGPRPESDARFCSNCGAATTG